MAHARVDILNPNDFSHSGISKTIYEAWEAGDWVGTFNLWVVQSIDGCDSILYQQRCFTGPWGAGLLDVTAGGHYDAGEQIEHGLREVKEELGKTYLFQDLHYLGKKLYLKDEGKRKLRYAVDVFIVLDNSALGSFILQRDELEGLYTCPIDDLIRIHTEPEYSFRARGMRFNEEMLIPSEIGVTKDSFPFNWDNYHFKMALIARRFLRGEKYIMY
jgi:hypothetical protein